MLCAKFDCLVIFSSHSKYSTCENEWALDKENIWELHVSTPYEFLISYDSFFFFFWLKKVLQATLTNLAKNNKLKCLLMYNKNLNYTYLYMHSHHWRQKARLSGNENQFQISSEVFEFHASFWPEIFSVLVRVQRTQELSQFC